MLKKFITVFIFSILSISVLAHGPSRQKVSLDLDINAQPQKFGR